MDTGFTLMIGLILAAHALVILGAVVKRDEPEMCICGRKFSFPTFGNYICSSCGKTHLPIR